MTNNKRIAKNTIYLYIRMFLLMLIGLYTARVTLQVLGSNDYGIYNVVAGIVVLFTFLNSALTAGVQRYLNFYLGENDIEDLKKIFSQSFRVFIVISFVIVIISETIGIVLLEYYMDIPIDRMNVARIVYQVSIVTTVISMMRVPFNATIIAYEKMSFYAYMSVVEGVLKLMLIFILVYFPGDKLIIYSILLALLSLILFAIYWIYCARNFSIINFKKYEDKELLKGILTFSGWNLLGSAANSFTNQGLAIVINHFFGVAMNAALGVANQANNAIYQFLSNFQTAYNPQIVKSYAKGESEYLNDFVIKTSKYSYFLLYFIIQPFVINRNYVLKLWLKDVPDHAGEFLIFLCAITLIDSFSGPLWMLAEAEGNIKKYQIVATVTNLAELVCSYVLFIFGAPAYTCFLVVAIGNFSYTIWRLKYLKDRVNFPAFLFLKEVFSRISIITVIGYAICFAIHKILNENFISFIVNCIFSCIVLLLLYVFIGMSKSERKSAILAVKQKVKKA